MEMTLAKTATEHSLDSLDQATLNPLVRKMLKRENARIDTWSYHRLAYMEMNPVSGGIYRLTGTAHDGAETLPWSLVLKAVRDPTGGKFPGGRPIPPGWGLDMSHNQYWKREPLAYTSGIFANLTGGLVAPCCYGMKEVDDRTIWLWLEDIQDEHDIRWPLEQYDVAARHLGQFNGTYLALGELPGDAWLCRGWLRGWVADKAGLIAGGPLEQAATWEHPLLRRAFPAPFAERLHRFWNDRQLFLDALDRLPQTICHQDAFRANLLTRRTPDGRPQTIAVDWAFVGQGAIGEEISQLVTFAMVERHLTVDEARQISEPVIAAYLAGLDDAGCKGNMADLEQAVRFAFAAHAALRWLMTLATGVIPAVFDEHAQTRLEQRFGEPFTQMLERRALLFHYLLDQVDTARTMLDRF